MSQETTSETSALSASAMEMADDVEPTGKDCPPERPPHSEAKPTCRADDADKADNLCGDTGAAIDAIEPVAGQETDPIEGFFHMPRDRIADIWEEAGRPIIHLGPGENCVDLEKLLSHNDINERHLAAIEAWLENRKQHDGGL